MIADQKKKKNAFVLTQCVCSVVYDFSITCNAVMFSLTFFYLILFIGYQNTTAFSLVIFRRYQISTLKKCKFLCTE